jgi:hypothetical protein
MFYSDDSDFSGQSDLEEFFFQTENEAKDDALAPSVPL